MTTDEPTPDDFPAPLTNLDTTQGEKTGLRQESTATGEPSDWKGRYRLLRQIGSGGMGTVYLAKDQLLDREVAMKIPRLPQGRGGGSTWLARFYREARIAAGFRHPDLCPVYDVGEHDGSHFLTMPVIPGESLGERLKRVKKLPPEQAIRLVARLAEAMQVAHAAGVIHRDLKPDNVMLRQPDDAPMIMDFGLAMNDAPGQPRITADGAYVGTPSYSSPEQLGGDRTEIGPASDVYSLGVILYQLLTGKVPYRGEWHDLRFRIASGVFDPPSALTEDVPPGLDDLCRRSLASDVADRFATMTEFAAALTACLTPPAVAAPAIPASPSPSRASRPLLFLGLGLGAVLITVLIASRWLPISSPSPSPSAGKAADSPVVPPDSPPANPPTGTSDRLIAGSRWSGRFSFKNRDDGNAIGYSSTLSLRVTERVRDHFRGLYRSEEKYEWEIEGHVVGKKVSWTFTKLVSDAIPSHTVVGNCECQTTLEDDELSGVFVNNQMHMTADIRLRRDD